jgi:hypothetical protein
MKKILSVMLALVVSGAAFAHNAKHVSGTEAIVMNSGSTVKLFYKSETNSNVTVAIYNEKHQRVYSESFHQVNGFARPYNFSDLKEGTYTIEVNDGTSHYTEEFVYKKANTSARVIKARLAKVTGQKGKYILSVPNKEKQTITVNIYDSGNRLQYSQQETLSGDFAKVYNVSKFGSKILFEVIDSKGNPIAVLD